MLMNFGDGTTSNKNLAANGTQWKSGASAPRESFFSLNAGLQGPLFHGSPPSIPNRKTIRTRNDYSWRKNILTSQTTVSVHDPIDDA